MSFLDIFAGIVLLIALASMLAVVALLAMAPGHVARKRHHPWAEAVSVAGWVTALFGFVFWPLAFIWAYVDVPRRAPAAEADAAPQREATP